MKNNKIETIKLVGYILKIFIFIMVFTVIPNKSVTNNYMMKVINEGLVYFIAVLGLSVILGMGGQVTFSTAGIMGFGAYICAILTTRYEIHTLTALLIALFIGGILSYLIGLALFRLKGTYFAFASIGLTQLLSTVMSNWVEVTGGPDGIGKIPKLDIFVFRCTNYYEYFRVYSVIALLCGFFVQRIRKTNLGRALVSIRDDELAAQCMGVNVYHTKVLSFLISGVFACLAGGLYAFHSGYISPEPFSFDQSAIYLIMIMLGGVDSTFGAFIGAMLLTILPEKMRFLAEYYKLIYGAGVIVLMVVMPMGIMGLYNNLQHRIHNIIKKRKQGEVEELRGEVADIGGDFIRS